MSVRDNQRAGAPLPESDLVATVRARETAGSIKGAARILGISRTATQHRLAQAAARGITATGAPALPTFPSDDLPTDQIIDLMDRRFTQRAAHDAAKRWAPIRMPTDEPIALSFVGDPHVDDDGCNWPLLRRHAALHAATPGFYAVNVGDTTNNWVGRLARLYANQETSAKTARKLAAWLLRDSGFRWLVWLMGNHDAWGDGAAVLDGMNVRAIWMEDWQAQFRLVFPGGRDVRIWCAHQFAGHSMWNTLHGPQRAAHTKSEAHIYAAGHTHNWALHQEESASREFVYWLVRARGYKFLDQHATHHGHASQAEGASVTAVIDPASPTESGLVQCFADMDVAATHLAALRARRPANDNAPRPRPRKARA